MRYVIVSVLKDKCGKFNNDLRKDIYKRFNIKSSKLPAHFTIKSPFESDNINELENILNKFSENFNSTPYKVSGYNHFDDRVIYMDVFMSKEGKHVHDELVDKLSTIDYINFDSHDGKDKVFHITISSKKLRAKFSLLWDYVQDIPCDFNCEFNNVSIFKWVDNTWVLHKEYNL